MRRRFVPRLEDLELVISLSAIPPTTYHPSNDENVPIIIINEDEIPAQVPPPIHRGHVTDPMDPHLIPDAPYPVHPVRPTGSFPTVPVPHPPTIRLKV